MSVQNVSLTWSVSYTYEGSGRSWLVKSCCVKEEVGTDVEEPPIPAFLYVDNRAIKLKEQSGTRLPIFSEYCEIAQVA